MTSLEYKLMKSELFEIDALRFEAQGETFKRDEAFKNSAIWLEAASLESIKNYTV